MSAFTVELDNQPGELVREEQPDGTILIRQLAPKTTEPRNNFVCDSPE